MLEPFRLLFTVPTWNKMLTLLRGTILARGRRTVTTALWQTGHHQDPHFSAFHQVLNRARWSPLEASRYLLALILETFVQAGGTLDVVIDETLERRWGAHIRKRGHYRDSALSSRKRSVSSPGLRWIVMALVVTLPWTRQRWALPFLTVLATTPDESQATGETPQNGRHARTSDGQFVASLASHDADQTHGGHGLQHPRTGAALRQASHHADCPVSPGFDASPTGSNAHQKNPGPSSCRR
jgi:hypothetical protein